MDSDAIRALTEAARASFSAGELSAALESYRQLERGDPEGPRWPHAIADVYRAMGERTHELAALARAAELYAASGAHLKSVVMCKRMLDLDPTSEITRKHLAALHPALRDLHHERPVPRPEAKPAAAVNAEGLEPVSIAELLGQSPAETGDIREIPIFTDSDVSSAVDSAIEESVELDDVPGKEQSKPFSLTPLFAALNQASFERLMERFSLVTLEPGEVLFRQGDTGESLYIIAEGSVEVVLEGESGDRQQQVLARLDEGEFFGEVALVMRQPRTATVRTKQGAQLIEISRTAIGPVLFEDPEVMNVILWFLRDRLVDTLIRTNPLFELIPFEERRSLADRFRFIEGQREVVLVLQGGRARGLMIVLAGKAKVMRTFGNTEIEVATLRPGDVFGEISLLTSEPAIASVVSEGHFLGLELPEAGFRALMAQEPQVRSYLEDVADDRRKKFVEALERADRYAEGKVPIF